MKRLATRASVVGSLAALFLSGASVAADHGDTPLLSSIPRNDAKITDFHAFTSGGNLVLSLSTNPAIPPSATGYTFPEDVTYRFHIDNDSPVSFDSADDNRVYGGTPTDPAKISADVVLEFTFDASGHPNLNIEGLPASTASQIQVFAGLRDDPFIRAPRNGRNIAAIVVELPLNLVSTGEPMLLWTTTKVPDVHGPVSEFGGRSLRSQFPENDSLNTRTPRQQYLELGLRPDVVVLDTSKPVGYPNGRLLTDDVVDLVGDARVVNSDSPFPTENDRPFLAQFPYLAEAQ